MAANLLGERPALLRHARIIGDNLGVVRYGAEKGHLRRPEMHRPMAGPLATCAEKGWQIKWRAVRRRLNKAADAVATEGVEWAHRLLKQGISAVRIRIERFTQDGRLDSVENLSPSQTRL